MLNTEKLKSSAYIEERQVLGSFCNNDIKNQWLSIINIPERYKQNYLDTYKKNEDEFFSSFGDSFSFKREGCVWIDTLQELEESWERLCAYQVSASKGVNEHPFFRFASNIAKFALEKATELTGAFAQAATERVIMVVLENATKVLIEELRVFKDSCVNQEEDCYEEFCNNLEKQDTVDKLIYKYPLMFRVIIEQYGNAVKYYKSVEQNYKKDCTELQNRFGISGDVLKVETNVGDSHRGKQQVLILHFEKGKIVYKPRNLGTDEKFGVLIDYINSQLQCDLKYANVYNCGDYGWQEFIEGKECVDTKEVERYYYKLGIYAGIFNLLMASDIHMENVVCRASNPFFIDLESLFQSYKGVELKERDVYVKMVSQLRNSVLSTCLFPGHMNISEQRDVSGVTGSGGQIVPRGKCEIVDKYTSDMRIERKDYITQDKNNIPFINGDKVEPRDYTGEIIDGFTIFYDWAVMNKEKLTKEGGLIALFYDLPVRTIVRHTANYGVLLKAATEPKYMSDAVMRNQLFDRLWLMVQCREEFAYLVPYEIEDMKAGDVPYFYTYINSDSLYSGNGEIVKNYHIKPMCQEVKERILEMDEEDKEFQVELIRESMAKPIKRWELKEVKKDYSYVVNEKDCSFEKELVLSECKCIMKKIEKLAFVESTTNQMSWIDLRISRGGQWGFMPMENALYSGTLGIGVVLAQLYTITKDDYYLKMVQKILNSSETFEKDYAEGYDLSAFNGTVATAYCYYYIGEVLDEKKLKQKAVTLILQCKTLIKNDTAFDIITGCAGALIVALRIWEKEHIDGLLDFAVACGEHLLENVEDREQTYGWQTFAGSGVVLAGMSHGNSGIEWALMELYGVTKEQKYYDCAWKAIEYENTLYNEADNNWTDMRNRENRVKKGFPEPVNWCHGAPGIGLSRIFCKRIESSIAPEEDIKHAITKTLKDGFGGSDCLCHGSLGNIEVLLESYQYYQKAEYLQYARTIVMDLLKQSKQNGWICGIPQNAMTPGFMTGLSGIVYGLLRVMDPDQVPDVLAFGLPGGENEKA